MNSSLYQTSNPTLGSDRVGCIAYFTIFPPDKGHVNSSLLPKQAFIDSLSFHFQYIKNHVHDVETSYDLCFALPLTDLRGNSNPE